MSNVSNNNLIEIKYYIVIQRSQTLYLVLVLRFKLNIKLKLLLLRLPSDQNYMRVSSRFRLLGLARKGVIMMKYKLASDND